MELPEREREKNRRYKAGCRTSPALGNGFRKHPRSLHRKRDLACEDRIRIDKRIKIESINPRKYKWKRREKTTLKPRNKNSFPHERQPLSKGVSSSGDRGPSLSCPCLSPCLSPCSTPSVAIETGWKSSQNVQVGKFHWLVFKSGFGLCPRSPRARPLGFPAKCDERGSRPKRGEGPSCD